MILTKFNYYRRYLFVIYGYFSFLVWNHVRVSISSSMRWVPNVIYRWFMDFIVQDRCDSKHFVLFSCIWESIIFLSIFGFISFCSHTIFSNTKALNIWERGVIRRRFRGWVSPSDIWLGWWVNFWIAGLVIGIGQDRGIWVVSFWSRIFGTCRFCLFQDSSKHH
jgi:hypothetical protein